MNIDLNLTPYTKIDSKQIKDVNVRPEIIKLLEENIEENLHNIGFGNDFTDMIPKAQRTELKIHKLDFMKIKNLGQQKILSTE